MNTRTHHATIVLLASSLLYACGDSGLLPLPIG